MQPTAQIITIGDELLLGQVVDTNSAFIGAAAARAGVRVVEIRSIGDQLSAIHSAIDQAIRCVDVVIITGGLGPTKDDITKRAIADHFGLDLVRDEPTYQFVRSMLTARSVEFNALNESQADIPRGFTALPNAVGTAPGLFYNFNGKLIFCLPGVPFEMKKLFTEQVLPLINQHFALQTVVQRTVVTFGLPESELAAFIAEWESALPHYLSLAYLPNPRGIRLRLTSRTESSADQIDDQFAALQQLIPDYYLGDDPTSVEQELAAMLVERGETLAVAESCTGGAISARCTALAGSSAWYLGGVTSYANQVKSSILGVDPSAIETEGAVSATVVAQMAEGVRRATGSTYAVATSGVAGPTGGSAEKPVGSIFIGVASERGTQSFARNFGQPRDVFVERASTAALNYLRVNLLKGILILILALIIPSAAAQQSSKTIKLDSLLNRMVAVNYSLLIGNEKVERAKVKHTAAPFLPTLSATATTEQQYGVREGDNLTLGGRFNWRLFDGLDMFYRYASSRENLYAEQIRLLQLLEDMVTEVSSRYYEIISIQNKVALLQHNLCLSRERYAQAKSKYNIGAGSGLEMRLAGADLNTDSSNLIKAREAVDLAYIGLNKTLRYPASERAYIFDSITLDRLPDKQLIIQRAMTSNSDILLAKSGVASNELSVKSAQAARYPTLDFAAAYNYGSQTTRLPSSFDRINGGVWGFTLGVNIFNGLETTRKIRSAKLDNQIAILNNKDTENQVVTQLEIEITLYGNSLVLVDLEGQNAEAMELNMTLAMERYRLGDLSGIDFRNIQQQYLTAIERKIATQYAAKSSLLKIINICGSIETSYD